MSSPHRVLLLGMMGAGKTTVGRELASMTGWPYLDNDELVRRATGETAPEVLMGADEALLRRVEKAAFEAALAVEPPVIASVAGGVVLDAEARQRMTEASFVVYLHAPMAVLAERVGTGAGRPWIDNDAVDVLDRLFKGREPLFREAADLVLDVAGVAPDALADAIVKAIKHQSG